MKKLLFIGVSAATAQAVRYAHEIGAYTIVTDYLPIDESPVKKLADEAWRIDIFDIDTLEKNIREEGVTGVFAAANDNCLNTARVLAERCGMPFYASPDAWRAGRDKVFFKEKCRSAGVPVPALYPYAEGDVLPDEAFPVIVKPTDGVANRGVRVCFDNDELTYAYVAAKDVSEKGEVLVEQYLTGPMKQLVYLLRDGEPVFQFGFEVVVLDRDEDGKIGFSDVDVFDVSTAESRKRGGFAQTGKMPIIIVKPNLEKELHVDHEAIRRMAESLHATDGVMGLQGIVHDGEFRIFEMNYRLDGCMCWKVAANVGGLDQVKVMVNHALGIPTSAEECERSMDPDQVACMYGQNIGNGIIASIEGLDAIERMEGISLLFTHHHIGDALHFESNTMDNFFQLGFAVYAHTPAELLDKLERIQALSSVKDTEGHEMLIPRPLV